MASSVGQKIGLEKIHAHAINAQRYLTFSVQICYKDCNEAPLRLKLLL